ncbi:site-specific DNA-methyltransferase [Acrocarpospora corrugata]|uniref:Site-specific DNA-methyltransferase n=1 Tax=Acrocarpospora corrugata TaxID=35763 RepID=A0A5M3W151_9ACTN|nr:site-specific DNA-methyltransferase [Acrocarpospora corrugata]GES01043.1 site-specific DNA-methyltransferase [Acrocarpospora corrugata]
MPPKKTSGPTVVGSFKHDDKRINIPTADSHDLLDEEAASIVQLRYPRNPELDPQLVWRGKDDQDSDDLVVNAPPIYIQEKIDPRVLIESLRRTAERPEDEPELTLFDDFDGLEGFEAVEYYQHQANWSNRMILGDSLQVMASLAEKENLRGKVQMIYIDPPYGIKFGSNFQPFVGKRDVTDGKATDITREVEQIKAFRDTWELGIHSYLSYLRDRLVVARDLLTESGSVFVQIGDENVHLVRALLDEVFGTESFVSMITCVKTSGQTNNFIPSAADYIVWYAKDVRAVKYRRLFQMRELGGSGSDKYDQVQLADGQRMSISEAEKQGLSGRVFRLDNLTSQSVGRMKGEGAASWFPVELGGRNFTPTMQTRWKTNEVGMERLMMAGRVQATKNTLAYVRFHDDFPAYPLSNVWTDIGGIQSRSDPKIYVVQTATALVQRCMLMATDPGDLVLDPTCGSGTTAYVAEEWGRRWITIDTSRVSLALARHRVMGAKLPMYLLADSKAGQDQELKLTGKPLPGPYKGDIRKGFVYKRVPHIMLSSIARNPDITDDMSRDAIDAAIRRHSEQEVLYDQPYEDTKKVRVAGPFTVESLAPHKTVTPHVQTGTERAATEMDASSFELSILDNLEKAGVQNGRKGERLDFESLVPYAGELINAEGDQKTEDDAAPQRIAVSIGPQYGTVDPDWIRRAAREALKGVGFDLLIVCAFAFDPQAIKTTEEFKPTADDFAQVQEERKLGKLPVLLVRMNSDLVMADVLKKTDTANLFMVFGEPDIAIERTDEGVVAEVRGVDVYDPTRGTIRSSGPNDIALWMIDTDYDGESFFVRRCYFTGGQRPYERLKKALRADIDEAAWEQLYTTRSQPFAPPSTGKIAIKVINHYGDEVLQVYDV